ncbi:get5 carboxyl domain-containing protein [Sarocladium implicatum]|nr:get5 carboxyl domain-containing protein [Sarocladium implicatum]
MSETVFAQNFLATLSSRPVKLSPDHVEDARNFPARAPYILPRMPKPMTKTTSAPAAPGQERSITLHIKSLRNPPLDIKLTSQPLDTTSVLDVKAQVQSQTRIPVEKMKLLHNKRPVTDSKVLKDLLGAESASASSLEFSVMVIGGAAAIPPPEEATKESVGETEDVSSLETEAFWSDLRGFLMQRLKDEKQADDLSRLFKSSYESSSSKP